MRIAYISASVIPSTAANSVHVMKMCQALAALDHDVALHAWKGRSNGGEDAFERYGIDASFELVRHPRHRLRGTNTLRYAWRVRRHLKRIPLPDLIYGRSLIGLSSMAGQAIPIAYEAHNPPANLLEELLFRRLLRSRHFLGLILISARLAAEYIRRYPWLDPELITVAHDGADPPCATSPTHPTPWPGRERAFQVGYVGNLYPGRGIELIQGMASALPQMDFHIVGGTTESTGQWRERLGSGVRNVHLHGFVPHGRLQSYFDRFEVLVAPYQERVSVVGGKNTVEWMSPLKIFEYMAQGLPIVCSDLSALSEILSHGVTALLVPPSDATAWSRALVTLQQDQSLRARLANEARKTFLQKHTWRHRAAGVLASLCFERASPDSSFVRPQNWRILSGNKTCLHDYRHG
ncbi:MAG: glycosyltransferase family 4 protein [Acidobacteriota bacterium]